MRVSESLSSENPGLLGTAQKIDNTQFPPKKNLYDCFTSGPISHHADVGRAVPWKPACFAKMKDFFSFNY